MSESDKKASKFLVQIRKKEAGSWNEVAVVNDAESAATVGDSFLGAQSAKAYRVLEVVAEKAR